MASALFARPSEASAKPARPMPNFLSAARRVTDWARPLASSSNLSFITFLSFFVSWVGSYLISLSNRFRLNRSQQRERRKELGNYRRWWRQTAPGRGSKLKALKIHLMRLPSLFPLFALVRSLGAEWIEPGSRPAHRI